MTTPTPSKHLLTFGDKINLFGIIVTVIGIIATVIGIVITFPQWGFTPTSITLTILGMTVLTVLIYLLVTNILLWFRNHFSALPSHHSEQVIDATAEEVVESPTTLSSLPPSDQTFLKQALEKLDSSSALMLLAQDHRIDLPAVTAAIYEQLQDRFGAENTYHLFPTGQEEATAEDYFSLLGQRLGWQRPCKSAIDLEKVLDSKLQQVQHFYLFLSRVEKGNLQRAKELAIALRGLVQMGKLKVLLLGSGKLEEFKFKVGEASLLDHATVERWPELTLEDVQWLYDQQCPQHSLLPAKDRLESLEICGGHPELLKNCFKYRLNHPAGAAIDYVARLQQEEVIVSAFNQLRQRHPTQLPQLCEWLTRLDVGPAQPYIFDDLLREVYWLNLLVARDGQLQWRGEAVRRAGVQMLGCSSRPA